MKIYELYHLYQTVGTQYSAPAYAADTRLGFVLYNNNEIVAHLILQTHSEGGWEYTIANADMIEQDGGLYDDENTTAAEVLNEIICSDIAHLVQCDMIPAMPDSGEFVDYDYLEDNMIDEKFEKAMQSRE